MNQLGLRIKELREARGMNQAQLATALGIKPSRVSQWETNARGVTLKNIVALARFFNVTTDSLLVCVDTTAEMA